MYAWAVSLKDKKGFPITKVFQEILDECGCKPNKIWVDKCSELYSRTMKSWLQDNYIEMYSSYNEGKSVVDETFIKILKKEK